jgi:hypothetical protein
VSQIPPRSSLPRYCRARPHCPLCGSVPSRHASPPSAHTRTARVLGPHRAAVHTSETALRATVRSGPFTSARVLLLHSHAYAACICAVLAPTLLCHSRSSMLQRLHSSALRAVRPRTSRHALAPLTPAPVARAKLARPRFYSGRLAFARSCCRLSQHLLGLHVYATSHSRACLLGLRSICVWQNQPELYQLKYASPFLRAPTCFKRYNPLACRVTSQ